MNIQVFFNLKEGCYCREPVKGQTAADLEAAKRWAANAAQTLANRLNEPVTVVMQDWDAKWDDPLYTGVKLGEFEPKESR